MEPITKKDIENIIQDNLIKHGESISSTSLHLFHDMGRKIDKLTDSIGQLNTGFAVLTEKVLVIDEVKKELQNVCEWKETHMLEHSEIKGKAWGVWKTITVIGGIILTIFSFVSGIAQNVFASIISSKL